jgi:hypothetical protein
VQNKPKISYSQNFNFIFCLSLSIVNFDVRKK